MPRPAWLLLLALISAACAPAVQQQAATPTEGGPRQGGTLITFRHSALGWLTEEHRKGVSHGWSNLLSRIKSQAESTHSRSASVQ